MMVWTDFVKELLANLVLASHIAIVLTVLVLVLQKIMKRKFGFSEPIASLIKKYGLWFAFIVALVSTLGSLFYSEILGFSPCKLCWYQRIFMYPLALIMPIAAWKKDRKITGYALPMCIIGGLIALYHYYVQFSAKVVTCGSLDAVDCSIRYIFHYNYITMPMMALTGFVMIAFFAYVYRKG